MAARQEPQIQSVCLDRRRQNANLVLLHLCEAPLTLVHLHHALVQTRRFSLTHDKPHMLFVESTLVVFSLPVIQIRDARLTLSNPPPHSLASQQGSPQIN